MGEARKESSEGPKRGYYEDKMKAKKEKKNQKVFRPQKDVRMTLG